MLCKCSATFQVLLLCGDISTNPGPVNVNCDNCMKTIRKNQKSVTCEICFGQRHLNCTELNIKCLTSTWTCPKCLFSVLPFSNCQIFRYVRCGQRFKRVVCGHFRICCKHFKGTSTISQPFWSFRSFCLSIRWMLSS